MGSITNFLEDEFLKHIVTAAFTPATTIYVALCTADPGEAATGAAMNEITGATGYARQAVTFDPATSRKVVQNAAVTFPQASNTWPAPIAYWALVSSPSGAGNVYAYGSFTQSFTPVAGNTPTIPSGQLQVEIQATAAGAGFTNYLVHKWLDLAFRNQPFPKPTTYIGLTLDVLLDTDIAYADVTEVAAGTGYARMLVNVTGGADPAWTAVAVGSGAAENLHAITFPTPTLAWGQVVSMMIIDSGPARGTAGNVLAYDSQNIADQNPQPNDTVQFAPGALDLALS